MEEGDSAAFIAKVRRSRAEYVEEVMRTARANLGHSRGDDLQFRDRAAEPLSAPERRSRGGGLPRDRTPSTTPPPLDTRTPTWAEERAVVLEAIRTWDEERASILDALRALCDLCETLHERITEIQKRPAHALYAEMANWADAERAHIAEEGQRVLPKARD